MQILVIEDDEKLASSLQGGLQAEGYIVSLARTGEEGFYVASRNLFDIVLLDVMLPGRGGLEILSTMRQLQIRTPVLMLTAKGQELDKVVGLDLGADDYVTKPFGVRELLARIHALLRRTGPPPTTAASQQAPFEIGGATIDPKTYQLRRGKKVEELTAKELKLLQVFFAHPGEVLSRDRLLNEVWGYNYFGTTRTLDQVMVQLRKKLGDNGDEPQHLLTVHGVGYKLIR